MNGCDVTSAADVVVVNAPAILLTFALFLSDAALYTVQRRANAELA